MSFDIDCREGVHAALWINSMQCMFLNFFNFSISLVVSDRLSSLYMPRNIVLPQEFFFFFIYSVFLY